MNEDKDRPGPDAEEAAEDKSPAGLLQAPAETPEEPPEADVEQSARARGSRLGAAVAGLALLVAIAAAAVAGLLWQRVQEQLASEQMTRQQLEGEIAGLASQLAGERQSRSQLRTDMSQAIAEVAEREAGLERALQEVREAAGRKRRGWLAAEAEYLVRIANHRLKLQRDVTGATKALEAADATLMQTGDPIFIDARKVLARDIQALRAVPAVDQVGLSLRLESLRDAVDTLPLAAPALSLDQVSETQTPTHASQVRDWRELVGAVWADIKSLVVIREREQGDMPLLAPEQRYFLTENLRLQFEQARLALLREDAALYRARLDSARIWMSSYFDVGAAATQASINTVDQLASVDIHPALPDVSQSLELLTTLRLNDSAAPVAKPSAEDDAAP